jgi:hypothetical protein
VVNRKVQVLFNQETLEGQTIDVSLNGLLVQAARTLAIGSRVSVRLFLSSGAQPLTADGTVARVAGPQMGIHLERVGQDACKRLQDFLLPLILPVAHTPVDSDD